MSNIVLTSYYEIGDFWIIRLVDAETLKLIDGNQYTATNQQEAMSIRATLSNTYSAQVIVNTVIVKGEGNL